MQDFAKTLFTIRREQVDLKYIFDHLRNYFICGAVFYIGTVLIKQGGVVSKVPYFNLIAGWFFQLLASILFSLNVTHGLFAIRSFSDKPLNRWLFAIFTVFLFFVMQELVTTK